MKLSEKQIQTNIIEMLNYHGCFVWRMNAGMIPIESKGKKRMVKLGRKGTSDIIGMYRRKKDDVAIFCAFEVKTPARKNNVTFYQQQFLEQVREMGGIAEVVTSSQQALEVLKKYELEIK